MSSVTMRSGQIGFLLRLPRAVGRRTDLLPAKPKGPSLIYFVRDDESGDVRIGTSARDLPLGSDIVGVLPGGRADAQALHRRFAHLKLCSSAEWFRSAPELEELIASLDERALPKRLCRLRQSDVL